MNTVAPEAPLPEAKSSGTFQIVEETLDAAKSDAIALLNDTRRHVTDESRFEWMYRQNPDGQATLWSLRNSDSGLMAGFTVCLPRRVMVAGNLLRCWIGADFSISQKFRVLGYALKLRRAARDAIDAGRADFLYSHPNEKMAAIHARVGHFPIGRMWRMNRPLRIGPLLAERFPRFPGIASAAGNLLNPLVSLRYPSGSSRGRFEISQLSSITFDDRLDQLWQRTSNLYPIAGVRDARYLNWRWGLHPLYSPRVLTATDDSNLAGFLIYSTHDDGITQIRDIWTEHPDATRQLLAALIRTGRQEGWRSLNMYLLETNPLVPVLSGFGFSKRPETSEMYGYAPESASWTATIRDKSNWFISVGDRDV